jgi:hypothetical protein
MINITDPKINDYLMSLSIEKDRHMLEMERIAKTKNFPIDGKLSCVNEWSIGSLYRVFNRSKPFINICVCYN